ncbi:ST7 protein [Aquisphaera giovannonii]|uniref:ST7 protein n=1 Tax=Aquisphaera giovannonii TaxID=406548 RepID=A0A5B9W2Y1_9BACT|nr:hypothetical protein [Aquisphaera giovannonii]QEH34441.1 ST7 protein [Aquisphaera giovannonii]
MARKKPDESQPGPKRPPRKKPTPRAGSGPEAPLVLPDRRLIERGMRDILTGQFGAAAETAFDRARELVYDALEEPDPTKRAGLAREALAVSPDVADAYVLLAEQAPTRKEALALYEQAVAAGERALGPEAFRDHAGHFWGILETRPYMRAREGLAMVLWALGRQDEAVSHLRDMLRLNPGDNQGVRYNLAAWLLLLDRDDELERLLDRYDGDGSAAWAYNRALLAFRRQGDTPESRKQLKAAQKSNRHVATYLLQDEPLPAEGPPYYSRGGEDEAMLYAQQGLSAWRSTPGALAWMKDVFGGKGRGKKAVKKTAAAGPTAAGLARLKALRREPDEWQVDARPMPNLVESGGELVQPWLILAVSRQHKGIMALEMDLQPPSPARIWDVLAQAMSRPKLGKPHRPGELQVLAGPAWEELAPHLEELGVECLQGEELGAIDFVFKDLIGHLMGDAPPGLLETPGVTPELVAGFYEAAAGFYRRAPWKSLGYEEAIRVECDRFRGGPWYAVVMGRSGMTLGLTLYTDLDLLRRMWSGRLADERSARLTVALTVHFDPPPHIPPADLLAGREHGWEVAGPDAYPSIFKKEKGMTMRPPLPWELELMEACLRAIPDFMAAHRPGDTTPDRRTVRAGSGEATLVLAWLDET